MTSVNTVQTVPNQPKTPARGVRVPDDLWEAFKAWASEHDTNASKALNDYMRERVGWADKD